MERPILGPGGSCGSLEPFSDPDEAAAGAFPSLSSPLSVVNDPLTLSDPLPGDPRRFLLTKLRVLAKYAFRLLFLSYGRMSPSPRLELPLLYTVGVLPLRASSRSRSRYFMHLTKEE
jgi:hypothetical protein